MKPHVGTFAVCKRFFNKKITEQTGKLKAPLF